MKLTIEMKEEDVAGVLEKFANSQREIGELKIRLRMAEDKAWQQANTIRTLEDSTKSKDMLKFISKVCRLVLADNKIDAIKVVREFFQADLKTAKDCVEGTL